jgi:hypothetical protein
MIFDVHDRLRECFVARNLAAFEFSRSAMVSAA